MLQRHDATYCKLCSFYFLYVGKGLKMKVFSTSSIYRHWGVRKQWIHLPLRTLYVKRPPVLVSLEEYQGLQQTVCFRHKESQLGCPIRQCLSSVLLSHRCPPAWTAGFWKPNSYPPNKAQRREFRSLVGLSPACLAALPAWSLHRAVSAQVEILCETALHAAGNKTLGDFYWAGNLSFPLRDQGCAYWGVGWQYNL